MLFRQYRGVCVLSMYNMCTRRKRRECTRAFTSVICCKYLAVDSWMPTLTKHVIAVNLVDKWLISNGGEFYSTNTYPVTCDFNPFPHTTILHQTTLNIFSQKIENLYNWMDNLWLKVENIVATEEIARFEQFLLLSLCFQKDVCCRGVRKRIYEGKR